MKITKVLFVPTLHPFKGQEPIELDFHADIAKLAASKFGGESEEYLYDFTDHGPVKELGWTESYYIKYDGHRIDVPYTLIGESDDYIKTMVERRSGMYTYVRE